MEKVKGIFAGPKSTATAVEVLDPEGIQDPKIMAESRPACTEATHGDPPLNSEYRMHLQSKDAKPFCDDCSNRGGHLSLKSPESVRALPTPQEDVSQSLSPVQNARMDVFTGPDETSDESGAMPYTNSLDNITRQRSRESSTSFVSNPHQRSPRTSPLHTKGHQTNSPQPAWTAKLPSRPSPHPSPPRQIPSLKFAAPTPPEGDEGDSSDAWTDDSLYMPSHRDRQVRRRQAEAALAARFYLFTQQQNTEEQARVGRFFAEQQRAQRSDAVSSLAVRPDVEAPSSERTFWPASCATDSSATRSNVTAKEFRPRESWVFNNSRPNESSQSDFVRPSPRPSRFIGPTLVPAPVTASGLSGGSMGCEIRGRCKFRYDSFLLDAIADLLQARAVVQPNDSLPINYRSSDADDEDSEQGA